MNDTVSPTSQFHPYQPPEAVPVTERTPEGLDSTLSKIGIDPLRMRGALERGRGYARRHPGRILGGMAAAVIGAGLLRSRMRRSVSSEPVPTM